MNKPAGFHAGEWSSQATAPPAARHQAGPVVGASGRGRQLGTHASAMRRYSVVRAPRNARPFLGDLTPQSSVHGTPESHPLLGGTIRLSRCGGDFTGGIPTALSPKSPTI